jgi:hypothetical protein
MISGVSRLSLIWILITALQRCANLALNLDSQSFALVVVANLAKKLSMANGVLATLRMSPIFVYF